MSEQKGLPTRREFLKRAGRAGFAFGIGVPVAKATSALAGPAAPTEIQARRVASPAEQAPYELTPEQLMTELGEYNAKILDASLEEMGSEAWYELAVNRRAAMVALMKKDPAQARKFIRDEEEGGENIKAREKLASVLEQYPSEAQRQRKEDLIEEEGEWEGTFVLSISDDLSQRPGMALYIKSDEGSVGFELATEEPIELKSQSAVTVGGIRLEYTILPNNGGVRQAPSS